MSTRMETNLKVIFLDHDGVICLVKQYGSRNSKKSKKAGEIFDRFCPKSIKILNEILQETDADIVVTSSWRTYCDLEYMQSLYKERGIIKVPIDFTQDLTNDWDYADNFNEFKDSYKISAEIRIKEIKKWLSLNQDITHWVAIDDLNLAKLNNFVLCESEFEGIKKLGLKEKIISFLR